MAGKKKIDWKNFIIRIASSAVILVSTLAFGIMGGWVWYAVCCIISLIALFEFYNAFQIVKTPLGVIGGLFGIAYWVLIAIKQTDKAFPLIVAAFLILMGAYVFDYERINAKQAMASVFGLLYTVVMLSYMYLVRAMNDGLYLVWLIYIGSWVCDSCAYLTGIAIGKHKMAPVLSPKKSIEGAIGGIIGAVLFGVGFAAFFGKQFSEISHPILACAITAGVSAVISMIGDLTASAFKRNQEIKDYSHIIPGHGGILDRFDSVIFVAPVIYLGAWVFTSIF